MDSSYHTAVQGTGFATKVVAVAVIIAASSAVVVVVVMVVVIFRDQMSHKIYRSIGTLFRKSCHVSVGGMVILYISLLTFTKFLQLYFPYLIFPHNNSVGGMVILYISLLSFTKFLQLYFPYLIFPHNNSIGTY